MDSKGIVFYYPQGLHYSYKKENKKSVFVHFSSDIGDTGQIVTAVLDSDESYTLKKINKMAIQYLQNLYPGEIIYNKTGKKHLKIYYKVNVEGKEGIAGIHLKIKRRKENQTIIAVMGAFLAEEDEKYREYFDTMLEKIEY